ncbi:MULTISPECIES: hypothetical protein [unclassified Variovorax]|jgi:hypothetical protein|uniref:hypothetical protein n=1 Tax=unclassified Variovorax TaxID=663243 RepID=UPI0008BBF4E6|nr:MULTISPECIES: hypothetical protein [unclassified Variovorax]SEJ94104.1 hypothetical protein SAMN05518853_10524 [Variovorax sp. OK202]SFD17398.1 hypothetical protein SAMN05444746_10564 [Variovorax sp. OK212]
MEILTLVALIAAGFYILKSREQRLRIALLGSHLGRYQIERLMESLTSGYLRCLGEDDAERRQQIWHLLDATEEKISSQLDSFAAEMSRLPEPLTRMSKLPVAIPLVNATLPATTLDLRQLLLVHARGIAGVTRNDANRSPKSKAYTMSAELFLLQHTCHWFCRSKTVASARMLARHQTSYAQLLDAVSPETRSAYGALTGS